MLQIFRDYFFLKFEINEYFHFLGGGGGGGWGWGCGGGDTRR